MVTARIGVVKRDGAGPVFEVAVAGEAEGSAQVALEANEGAAHKDVVRLACGLAEAVLVAVRVQRIRVAVHAEGLVVEAVLGVAVEPDRVVADDRLILSETAPDLDLLREVLLEAPDLLGRELEALGKFRWRQRGPVQFVVVRVAHGRVFRCWMVG